MNIRFLTACLAALVELGSNAHANNGLTVAVSANARYAMEEISLGFTKETAVPVRVVVGSSGKLSAQIKAGAPFDIFVSADIAYPQKLYDEGFAVEPPTIYGYGTLVISSVPGTDLAGGLSSLLSEKVRRIAVANPDTAPYGSAAIAALRNFGIYEKIKNKLVFGESVSQVNQFVSAKAADASLTAKSSLISGDPAKNLKWVEVDASLYPRLAQGQVILKHGAKNNMDGSKRFLSFIGSDKGKIILNKFGYTTP